MASWFPQVAGVFTAYTLGMLHNRPTRYISLPFLEKELRLWFHPANGYHIDVEEDTGKISVFCTGPAYGSPAKLKYALKVDDSSITFTDLQKKSTEGTQSKKFHFFTQIGLNKATFNVVRLIDDCENKL